MEKLQVEIKSHECQLKDADAAREKITKLKLQNARLLEACILLKEEVSSLQAKVNRFSSSEMDNMTLQVHIEAMESQLQEENLWMQELL